jgi:hypothetical protein
MPQRFVAQSCRVERWRGYVTSSFFVRFPDGSVLESPRFRWRGAEPPPETDAARAALADLVERVVAAGWTAGDAHGQWFATSFTRHVQTAEPRPRRVEAPAPDPAPVYSAPPAPPPPPAAAVTPPAATQRPRRLPLLAAAAGACVTASVAAVVLLHGNAAPVKAASTRPPAAPRQTHADPVLPPPTQTPTKAVPAPRLVDVRIAAVGRSGSWVEVRRGSETGSVLYAGTLLPGATLHFRAQRLWARFGAASNLAITADGRPVRLQGTFDKLFVP